MEWFLENEAITHENIQNHENPDFLVKIDEQITGVEVTNLYLESSPGKKGSKIKAAESRRTKWLRALAAEYYKRHQTPIRLNLWTNFSLCQELEDAILSKLKTISQIPLWKPVRYEIELEMGRRCVAYVMRLPSKFHKYSRWTFINDHVGFVGDISWDHIINAVDKKSVRVTDYLKCCDRVWLILVADGGWNSGRFQIPNNLPILAANGFEKVWLMDYSESIHRIKVEPSVEG
ncbi:MAG: hypothetical protein BWX54_02209 [Verrucomicrobia bacterium ADurb.Bin018]|nr:MAG: hypothetical protein BWX54_02209 [Verrucomicrobia bacterium ADurb.Bin018]